MQQFSIQVFLHQKLT